MRRETIAKLIRHEGKAIAVGTTSVRTLESLYYMGLKVLRNPDLTEDQLHVSQWEPYENHGDWHNDSSAAEIRVPVPVILCLQALLSWMDAHDLQVLHSSTQIIIAPGYDYKIVKMLSLRCSFW